ncbi:hypothetical protein AB0E88_01265 [Streptomyces sp. NPDC028635]
MPLDDELDDLTDVLETREVWACPHDPAGFARFVVGMYGRR